MIFRSGLRASDIRLSVQPFAHFSPWIISAMWIFSLPEVSHSHCQWIGLRENFNRKAPYLMGKSMEFPVKIFPNKTNPFTLKVAVFLVTVYVCEWWSHGTYVCD